METHYPPTYRTSDACESDYDPPVPHTDDARLWIVALAASAFSGALAMLVVLLVIDRVLR